MLESADVPERILRRLNEMDRSKEWLAGRLSVDAALVHRWLKGTQAIPEARLREIALVLHRPVSWFTEDLTPSPPEDPVTA